MASTTLVTLDNLGNFLSDADSGFETGNGTGWAPIYLTGIGAVTTQFLDGSHSLACGPQYANYFSELYCTTYFPIVGRQEYFYSLWAKGSVASGPNGCAIVAYWYTSPGVSASVVNTIVASGSLTTSWQQISGYITAPPDALYGLILFDNWNVNIGDTYYLDRVVVKPAQKTAVSGSKTTISHHQFISNLEQGDDVYPSSGTIGDWASGYANMVASVAPDGTPALQHTNSSATSGYNAYGFPGPKACTTGQFFKASVRVWGPADRFNLAIGFYSTIYGVVGGGQVSSVNTGLTTISSGGWTILTISGIVPAGAITAQLVWSVFNGNGTTSFYTTDWQLNQQNDVIARIAGIDSISMSDTSVHSDVIVRAMTIVRQYADTNSLSDVLLRYMRFNRGVNDVLVTSDGLTRSLIRARTLIDNLGHSDITQVIFRLSQLIVDTNVVVDILSRQDLTLRLIQDTMMITDQWNWLRTLLTFGNSYSLSNVDLLKLRRALTPKGMEMIRQGATLYPLPLDGLDDRSNASTPILDVIKPGATMYPYPVTSKES